MRNSGGDLTEPVVQVAELRRLAWLIRRRVLSMASGRGEGYVGQGLGIADILAVLYGSELRRRDDEPLWDGRDRFVLSTGHYAIGLYAALAEVGVIPANALKAYAADGDALPASTHHEVPGVESTTGSLGQGLPLAAGMAIAAQRRHQDHRVVVLSSDGELQEGSTWEAAMFAGHHRLSNLVNLIDVNRTQADGPLVLEIEPLADKFRAFGWHADECDGNDVSALGVALDRCRTVPDKPKAIVCRTRLGSGVPLIQHKPRAHFVRVAPEEWALAARQLEETL